MIRAERLARAERLLNGFCPTHGLPMIFEDGEPADRYAHASMRCEKCGFRIKINLDVVGPEVRSLVVLRA